MHYGANPSRMGCGFWDSAATRELLTLGAGHGPTVAG